MTSMIRIVVLATLVLACSAAPNAGGGEVTQDALVAALRSGAPPVVLDVRSAEEFAAGRVPGARNLPIDELASRAGEIEAPRDAEIVVYCERGPRARQAQAALAEAGFTNVRHLEGDMSAWRESGLPCDGC